MKVLEFKAYPNQAAIEQINVNITACRHVWNECLAIKLEERHRYQRSEHGYPVPFGLVMKPRFIKQGKKTIRKYTGRGIVRTTPKGESCAPRCPVRTARSQMAKRLDDDPKLINKVPTLGYWGDHTVFNDKRICTRFLVGMSGFTFKESWAAFLDKNRPNSKQPKFKSSRNNPSILINAQGNVKVERLNDSNGYVIFPKGLQMRVKGLFDRLTKEHTRVAIVIRPSGYYVQFCVPGDAVPLPPKTKAVGIDPGVRSLVALSNGRQYQPNQRLATLQKRLKRYQRKMSRQHKGSKGWNKTKLLIARLHEKIARSRNAYNHKVSSRLVDEFGAIAFEDTKLTNMTRKAKPKPDLDKPGQFLHNGAAAKSGLNRAILNVSIGDLRAKTEGKAKAAGRSFVKVDAPYTSQTCHACGVVDAASRKGKQFVCVGCGHTDDADTNAAKNILSKGLTLFKM